MTQRRDVDAYLNDVKRQLDEKLLNATTVLSSIEEKLLETETNRKQSAENLAALNSSYNQTIELITQTRTDLAQISELRTKALDPTTGVAQIVLRIDAIEENANTTANKIEELRKNATSYVQGAKEYNEKSKVAWKDTSSKNEKATTILKDLEQTYQLAVNTGLAGSFNKRAKELETEYVKKWQKRFFVSLVLVALLAIVILVISFLKDFSLSATIFFRLALITPLIFYTGYSAIQYSKERRLHEKYAFKAVVATSLESYTNLLTKKFTSDPDNKIIDFVVTTMGTIYFEPHEEVKRRSFGFGVDNKLTSFKAELIEDIRDIVKKSESDGAK